jgi:hypothetical protein
MIRAACMIILLPALASAAGWTAIQGKNSGGEIVVFRHVQTITVQKQGEEQAYVQHVKADVMVSRPGTQRRYPSQDCLHSTRPDDNAWLSCSPDGASPLAGTTYHQAPPGKGSVSPWVCIRNCSAASPLIMRQAPWE